MGLAYYAPPSGQHTPGSGLGRVSRSDTSRVRLCASDGLLERERAAEARRSLEGPASERLEERSPLACDPRHLPRRVGRPDAITDGLRSGEELGRPRAA